MNKICIIDDSEKICKVLKKILENAGYLVRTETNSVKAINFLEGLEDPSDLSAIFLDLMMPEMSGYEFLTRFKSNDKLKRVPVVILTSKDGSSDMMKGYELGANYYLPKPATQEQVLFAVESVVALA